ncbi:MAG: hypothetical protein A2074_08155 [Candidatus Aquicultor primus]|uniref:Phage tail collar domain-containing protein n=1 Tax=Candidatus Aquicultor primus TaxID=1797195 RepID=A0A1F2UNX6_9ACTN|nr:MAG: hypothetical protein A2074_08155 [Candidatus Aquicultor primus]
MKLDAGVIGVVAPVSPVFLFSAGGKMKRYILMLLFSVLIQADLFAQQSQNSISIQGRLSSTEAVQGVQVEIFANGVSVSTASPIDLLPDPSGVFTSYISGFDPVALQVPAGLFEISLKSGEVEIARIPLMTVPFALAVRGIKDGDNIVGATGNIGIGTINPEKKLSVTGDVMIDGDLYARNLVGAVMFFYRISCPAGFLTAKGQQIMAADYPGLAAAIGKTGTFNLPDLRGEFLRGADDGRGVDPGRLVGSSQLDAFKAHSHSIYSINYHDGPGGYRGGPWFGDPIDKDTSTEGDVETRPRNIALLPCIKY